MKNTSEWNEILKKSLDFDSVYLISNREDIYLFTKKVIGDNFYLNRVQEIAEMTFVVSAFIFIDLSSCSLEKILRYHLLLNQNSYKILYYVSCSVDENIYLLLKEQMVHKIVFPCSEDYVKNLFEEIVEKYIKTRQNEKLEFQLSEEEEKKFDDFIGSSKISKNLKNKIIICSKLEVPILLLGETGTGKSTAARIIHNLSARKNNPFVAINISNYEQTLADSELFGSEKGAFTDAVKRDGKFQIADEGTLFIDEIANASVGVQGKLLKVLDDGSYFSLGSDILKKTNVRLIFATNADLKMKIVNKEFRNDLYYRINGYSIYFPPLCERKEDISEIARHLAMKNEKGITEGAIKKLEQYNWPGNIRQLQYCINNACKTEKDKIDIQDIDFDV